MATLKQIAANRRNAQNSTGPTTPEGKHIVSHNAVQFGLTGARSIIFPEEREPYEQFAGRMRYERQPQDALEELLVEQMIDVSWRLRRIARIESGIFLAQASIREGGSVDQRELSLGQAFQSKTGVFSCLARHERALARSLWETIRELDRRQYARMMDCHPFYVANLGKFPSLGEKAKRKEEGRFESKPAGGPQ